MYLQILYETSCVHVCTDSNNKHLEWWILNFIADKSMYVVKKNSVWNFYNILTITKMVAPQNSYIMLD